MQLTRRIFIGTVSAAVVSMFATKAVLGAGVVDFTVFNESSSAKTFNFIDEGNNSHATYNMAAGQKAPLRLVASPQGFGAMRYNSNFQAAYTRVGFIKAGSTVNLY